MHFEALSTKYVNFNRFGWFFENFDIKFLFFWQFFLSFLVGETIIQLKNQNFQAKSHEFSLFIRKNLNIFYIKLFANRLETCKSDLYKLDTCKRLATSSLTTRPAQLVKIPAVIRGYVWNPYSLCRFYYMVYRNVLMVQIVKRRRKVIKVQLFWSWEMSSWCTFENEVEKS